MSYLKVKTKGNSNPQGKPRVYFTCHPKDFENGFEKICDDILKTQDCAIYYTEDMTAEIPAEYRDTDLNRMNLFVVPITFRLLTEANRAMDSDIQFAFEKHIPILPIMLEIGIDEFYAQKFGKLQYLNPYSRDLTEISYEEKLKKYLSGILFDDETAEKVRAAFDAYIFLSYRKKDRKYANKLMQLIHSNPICRDIAIWYDEFLTPGESFSDSIERMLEKSDLFALLVTPNLVNEENYVKSVEYPAAKKADKKILPAEMVSTDVEELKRQYEGIPDSVNANDDTALKESLVKAFSSYALRENDNDPMHNYLIGLAYLEGVDVEINREKAVELITSAAEAELPEAMEKLRGMYLDGYCVALDWHKSHIWTQRLADYYARINGEKDEASLTWLHNLAYTYGNLDEHEKALELYEKAYALRCEMLGKNHPDALITLNNLACTYIDLGDHKKALKLFEKVYALRRKILGEKHPDTLNTLSNLACAYDYLCDHKKALDLQEKVFMFNCEVWGEKHPRTLTTLHNLAFTYGKVGDYKKAFELYEKVYEYQCEALGEKHPDTLTTLDNLAYIYAALGNRKKTSEIEEKVYSLSCETLGEKHPRTLKMLHNLACAYAELGNHKKALELLEKAYALHCEILGEKHPDTLRTLHNIAVTYGEYGDYKKESELVEKVYMLRCETLGEKHPDTLATLSSLAFIIGKLGDRKKALELYEKVYSIRCEVLGKEHTDTLSVLSNIAYIYGELENWRKAYLLFEKVYIGFCGKMGKSHPDTLVIKQIVDYCRGKLQ